MSDEGVIARYVFSSGYMEIKEGKLIYVIDGKESTFPFSRINGISISESFSYVRLIIAIVVGIIGLYFFYGAYASDFGGIVDYGIAFIFLVMAYFIGRKGIMTYTKIELNHAGHEPIQIKVPKTDRLQKFIDSIKSRIN
ncbi:MAG: hypothetical protein ACFB2Y_09665 [Fulvivirga sp.]